MSAVAGRRTYTEDELQAALRDIQSGKLGTRRAAVIYGIPRSTLRNKVYKLAMERERESHLNPTPSLKIDEDEAMDDDKELSGAEEEKEVEKALQAPLLTMADILRFSNLENQEALRTLLLKGKEATPDIWAGLEHSAVGPYIQNILAATSGLFSSRKHDGGDLSPVLPEFLKRMVSEEETLKEHEMRLGQHNNNGDIDKISRPSPSNSVVSKSDRIRSESDAEGDESSASNVILKIPSFKPTSSGKNGSDIVYRSASAEPTVLVTPPVTSESGSPPILPGRGMTQKDVKDIIAKSISQKFQQLVEPLRIPPLMEMECKRGGFTPPLAGIPMMKNQQDLARAYQASPSRPQPPPGMNNPPNSGSTSSTATGGKGTRPKRGKYRNYDRDSLVEAVRAVQRGEMSVHRAGSYYGVPHSTLEYKVKERHLMRPRKRDPKPNPVDEKIASLKQNDLRGTDKPKPVIKPSPPAVKFTPGSPNGMKLPLFDPSMAPLGYNPPPFPFWPHPGFSHIPLDYGRTPSTSTFPPNPEQFFASQMMQKLQEESIRPPTGNQPPPLPKSARQMAESLLDGSGSNGSFLDGIIRSSLESGVPTNDDKSPKDDKNVSPENMSNKALLDQLCRNSRLTPLPKPNLTETTNSSSDDNFRKDGTSPLNFSAGNSKDGYERENNPDVHTIELSNDSTSEPAAATATPPARIYLKHELTKPENLKPEMLMRFRDVLQHHHHRQDGDGRNGISESAATTGSASDSEAAQD